MPASTPGMALLVSVIIILNLNSEPCFGRRKHLLLEIEDTNKADKDDSKPSVNKHARERGEQDYQGQVAGGMSGEANGNTGVNGTMDVRRTFRCTKCVIGPVRRIYVCRQCAEDGNTEALYTCGRCNPGTRIGNSFDCRRCTYNSPNLAGENKPRQFNHLTLDSCVYIIFRGPRNYHHHHHSTSNFSACENKDPCNACRHKTRYSRYRF